MRYYLPQISLLNHEYCKFGFLFKLKRILQWFHSPFKKISNIYFKKGALNSRKNQSILQQCFILSSYSFEIFLNVLLYAYIFVHKKECRKKDLILLRLFNSFREIFANYPRMFFFSQTFLWEIYSITQNIFERKSFYYTQNFLSVKRFFPFKCQSHKMVSYTQTIRRLLPTTYLSKSDHFVELAFKGLRVHLRVKQY